MSNIDGSTCDAPCAACGEQLSNCFDDPYSMLKHAAGRCTDDIGEDDDGKFYHSYCFPDNQTKEAMTHV